MEHLIRFMSLSKELTDKEFAQFVFEYTKSTIRDSFLQKIFNEHKNTPHSIVPYTKIITKIINSRKSLPKKQTHHGYSNLLDLPSVLIGECATFLLDTEFFEFTKTSRKIYLSCNSPFKLYKISHKLFNNIPETSNLSTNKYKSTKKSFINIEHFNNLSLSNQLLWKQNTLDFNTLSISNINGDINDANTFINNQQSIFTNVNTLKLDQFDPNSILSHNFMHYFPNIQYIYLNNIHFNVLTNYKLNTNLFAHLKGIKIGRTCDKRMVTVLINGLREQLEVLSLRMDINNLEINDYRFPQLKQIEIDSTVGIDKLEGFTVKNIRINIAGINKYEVKQCIYGIIQNKLYLKSLYIGLNVKLMKYALEQLESVIIFEGKDIVRKSENILIEFEGFGNWNFSIMNMLYFPTVNAIKALEMMKIKYFKLKIIIHKKGKFDKESKDVKDWISELNDINKKYLVEYEFDTKLKKEIFRLNISNKKCNGWNNQNKNWFVFAE